MDMARPTAGNLDVPGSGDTEPESQSPAVPARWMPKDDTSAWPAHWHTQQEEGEQEEEEWVGRPLRPYAGTVLERQRRWRGDEEPEPGDVTYLQGGPDRTMQVGDLKLGKVYTGVVVRAW